MLPNLATGRVRAAVKVISSDDLIENGGSFRLQGRVAFRVNNLTGQTNLPASHQAMAVYPITQADIDSGRFALAGGGPAVRVVDIDSEGIGRAVMSGGAVPVYVVEGEALGVSVPDVPTNLVATQNGATQIDLTWNVVDGADGYYIERSDGADDNWVQIDSVGAVTTYADTGLSSNIYYYRIRAYNTGGESGYSNEAAVFLYVLFATFTNAEGPPVGSPYIADVGQLTLVQNDSRTFTIASDYMATSGASSVGWSNRIARSDAVTRAYGICMMFSFYRGSINENAIFGWSISTTAPDSNAIALAFFSNGGASWSPQGFYTAVPDITTNNTWYTFALVLRSTGAFIYIKGGVYAEWQQVWVDPNNNVATLYSIFSQFSTTNTARMDDWKIGRLPAPFTSDANMAVQLVTTATSDQVYAGVDDGTFDLTMTAPAVILTTCELRFRVQDASNYWVVYANIDGSISVDSVNAGVPTNRLAPVAGVFAGSALRIVRVRTHGSKINIYTRTSATALWSKRGAEINVSYLDGLTDVVPVAGVGWTLGALHVWRRTPSATELTALLAMENAEPGAIYDGSGGWFVAP